MQAKDIEGIIPAVIVPMRADYSIDYDAYRTYLRWMVGLGPVGLAVNVDTGEGPYLTAQERAEVIRVTREIADGQCKIIAGCGGPSTAMAMSNARAAQDAGADALLVFPTPAFGNDPLDPEIAYQYHLQIAGACELPLILFQLSPIFGGINYTPDALRAMLSLPQVIGIKDASFDAQRFCMVRDIVNEQDRKIALLTGNDNFMLESFLLGADGGLLGYGAVGAGLLIDQLKAVKAKEFDLAKDQQATVQGFCEYIYGRPIGDYRARCKVALVHMGLLTPELTFVRPPYQSLWSRDKDRALAEVRKFGLENVSRS